ncbi:MAG: hypothetical protein FJZ58_02070 [Chlamydiae bacterium]|nr:hypothetical protein [Chlamydiota bacterium]
MNVLYALFLSWWRRDPPKACCWTLVITLHFFALCVLFFASPLSPPQRSHLIVKTLSPSRIPPKTVKQTAGKSSPMPTQKATPKQKQQAETPTPIPKKTIQPAPKKKSPPPSKNTTPAPSPTPRTPSKKQSPTRKQKIQESLEKLEKSIAQIEEDRATMRSPSKLPHEKERVSASLQEAFALEGDNTEDAYIASLTAYLQDQLQLPDVGEVTVQMTISVEGKVESMKVLSSESMKNKKRIEERLPKLSLPPVKRSSHSQTFIITFCNEA